MTSIEIRDFYTKHSPFSDPGKHADALRNLPDDIEGVMAAVQGLVIYDAVAKDFYGCDLSEERTENIHIRPVEAIIDSILAFDDRPLTEERAPESRVTGRCRNFVILMIGALREKGIPARARCGFGAYFNPGSFEDHWVCEYWDSGDKHWKFADPQFDATWQRNLSISHNVTDVPRDGMLVAGDAWAMVREDKAEADQFGISFANMHGQWMIAGNLVRDIAALNRMELQPWDVWGAQPQPDQRLDDDALTFFDSLAELSREPDGNFEILRDLYAKDDRLIVPAQVFNALRNRPEPVDANASAGKGRVNAA